jgi:hypothetical protein
MFSGIEGSMRLVKGLRHGYAQVLDEHQRLVRAAIAAHGGHHGCRRSSSLARNARGRRRPLPSARLFAVVWRRQRMAFGREREREGIGGSLAGVICAPQGGEPPSEPVP